MTNNEKTYFPASMYEFEEVIGEAHAASENSGRHPLKTFAEILDKSWDQFGHLKQLPFLFDRSTNGAVSQPFFMPEPAPLLSACIFLGVHPADLVPREYGAPTPRSIV